MALFKEVGHTSPNAAWVEDRFVLTVWKILHEELRCLRQGRLSAPGGPKMAPQHGMQMGTVQSPMFAPPPYGPGGCMDIMGITYTSSIQIATKMKKC